jgi:ABC-type microcin C transport system permease subunit YejB
MRDYLIRRIILIPILLLGITIIDFVFINLAPGARRLALTNPSMSAICFGCGSLAAATWVIR